jgi:hypothetical protein
VNERKPLGGGGGGGSAAGLLVLASTVAGVARWLGGASDHDHPRCPLRPHGFERWMAVWSGWARQMLLATSSNVIGQFRYVAWVKCPYRVAGKASALRMNAHTELRAKRPRSAREAMNRNRPV